MATGPSPLIGGVVDDLELQKESGPQAVQRDGKVAALKGSAEPPPSTSWKPSPADLIKDAFQNAKIIPLHAEAVSPVAVAVVGEIRQSICAWEDAGAQRQRKRKASGLDKLDKAIGTILAGLLLNWSRSEPKASSRTLKTNEFSGEPIGAVVFTGTIRAMISVGLIRQKDGYRGRPKDRYTARYWPAPDLIRLVTDRGIVPSNVRQHFRYNAPKTAPEVAYPLRLTAPAKRNKPPEALSFDPAADDPSRLIRQIKAMNSFAAECRVENCLPPRWHRSFTHNWQHHGRWYAAGGEGNYQHKTLEDRLGIRINGEAVVEVDISASYLTILHAVLGLEVPTGDLYAIPGMSRPLAKGWINATISKGSPVKRWSPDMREALGLEAAISPVAVGAAVLGRYPFLGCLPQVVAGSAWAPAESRLLSHRLMFIEASIITRAMDQLCSAGILALPMHDGLLVPASAQEAAKAAICAAGVEVAGVQLRLKVDG